MNTKNIQPVMKEQVGPSKASQRLAFKPKKKAKPPMAPPMPPQGGPSY